MSTRDALAEAASLPNVTNVAVYYRSSLKPGDGFIRMAQRSRDDSGFGFMQTWEVWLALPASPVDAEKWLDAHLGVLLDALNTVMVVTTATPSELVLGASSVNGVIISGAIAA
jgi:hypothetical protein